jgi:hypothetical protein
MIPNPRQRKTSFEASLKSVVSRRFALWFPSDASYQFQCNNITWEETWNVMFSRNWRRTRVIAINLVPSILQFLSKAANHRREEITRVRNESLYTWIVCRNHAKRVTRKRMTFRAETFSQIQLWLQFGLFFTFKSRLLPSFVIITLLFEGKRLTVLHDTGLVLQRVFSSWDKNIEKSLSVDSSPLSLNSRASSSCVLSSLILFSIFLWSFSFHFVSLLMRKFIMFPSLLSLE